MLYSLGPGDLLLCRVPFFLIIGVTFVALIVMNGRGSDRGDDDE